MAENAVNAQNVAVGKPNIEFSGGVMVAPVGTERPANATSAIDLGYLSTGYVGEDGVTESSERSTEDIRAWGGTKVRTVQTEFGTTLAFTLIESRRLETLRFVFGESNVSLSGTSIKVRRNEKVLPHVQVLIDMLDGENARRLDAGYAQITEIGDITYSDGEAIGYEVTVSCDPDKNNDTLVEYVQLDDGEGENPEGPADPE